VARAAAAISTERIELADQPGDGDVSWVSAHQVDPFGHYDLVIDPSNLWLVIHESIGHATELNGTLGYEADYVGTSFATRISSAAWPASRTGSTSSATRPGRSTCSGTTSSSPATAPTRSNVAYHPSAIGREIPPRGVRPQAEASHLHSNHST
jgi:hypothetical protein